jgi:hypothetical protein
VILCVAFPNLLLRRLGFQDLGSGGVFLGILGILGISGETKELEKDCWGDLVCVVFHISKS